MAIEIETLVEKYEWFYTDFVQGLDSDIWWFMVEYETTYVRAKHILATGRRIKEGTFIQN